MATYSGKVPSETEVVIKKGDLIAVLRWSPSKSAPRGLWSITIKTEDGHQIGHLSGYLNKTDARKDAIKMMS